MGQLFVRSGEIAGSVISLDGDEWVVGRNVGCEVRLPDSSSKPKISRFHARIRRVGDDFEIIDLNSRNGTEVNHQEVKSWVRLRDGDQIDIGGITLGFSLGSALPSRSFTFADSSGPPVTESLSADPAHYQPALKRLPAERRLHLADLTNDLNGSSRVDTILTETASVLLQLYQADHVLVVEGVGETRPPAIFSPDGQPVASRLLTFPLVQRCQTSQEAILASDERGGLLAAPLTRAGGAVGLLAVERASGPFDSADLAVAVELGRRAGNVLSAALDRERARRDNDALIARNVQNHLLPKHTPALLGYQFFRFYQPAQSVGGDYYDFIPLPDGRYAILVGDVSGKGVSAALLMVRLTAEARFCIPGCPDLASGFDRLNENLHPIATADDRCHFVTLIGAVLDPATHTVTLASAGHQPALLCRAHGGELSDAFGIDLCGLPLGIEPRTRYAQTTLTLDEGDSLVLFTDGLTDGRNANRERFDTDGIRRAIRQAKPGRAEDPTVLGNRVMLCAKLHSTEYAQFDDITMICFGRADGHSDGNTYSPI